MTDVHVLEQSIGERRFADVPFSFTQQGVDAVTAPA
jgi:hypothetical protein